MTDDKFIMMGMDDDRAGDVASVLSNKTCKKILDYLSEVKEASEQDMAKSLSIPINTVEYNIKKLVRSGLVEKAKNHFWSVKGKKIALYKVANKHIIISPKKQISLTALKAILPIVVAFAAIFLVVGLWPNNGGSDIFPVNGSDNQVHQFGSYEEMKSYIKINQETSGFFDGLFGEVMRTGVLETAMPSATTGADSSANQKAGDYSTTNIQVEGVDEADIVKNDDQYIYVVTGNKIVIINAYPAEVMKIISEIKINGSVNNIYIKDNKLIVFANDYGYYSEVKCVDLVGARCGGYYDSSQTVEIYDISDRENPELENEILLDGNLVDSRMIGDYVYVISNKYINSNDPEPPVYYSNGAETKVMAEEIYYFPYIDDSYTFTSVMAIDLESGEFNSEVYLLGSSQNIFVSEDNIYLTYTKYREGEDYLEELAEEVYFPLLPSDYDAKLRDALKSEGYYNNKLSKINGIVKEYSLNLKGSEKSEFDSKLYSRLIAFESDYQKKREKTIIHKINVDDFDIDYENVGEVPGHVLNQFSMDEFGGYFRIATTTGQVSRSGNSGSLNHLFVLDDEMNIVGSVEDLAEGEQIYSARFMGNRAYIVTFKKVDPLFVIDLTDPEDPEVLGYLKITGFSDYLHPYDENHVIGIGKETKGGNEDFSWYQGVKISLFDVSDFSNPIESAKIEIGDRGTSSEALYDHKAVLFDKERNLLVIPIELYEINESKYEGREIPDNAYGTFVWNGVYVLNIDTDEISVRGKITHENPLIPASEELIGAERLDWNGNVYIKTGENLWKTDAYNDEAYNTYLTDLQVDRLPGGISYSDYTKKIRRSLYMDNYLYTVSLSVVKANHLNTIEDISRVDLGYEDDQVPVVYGEGVI